MSTSPDFHVAQDLEKARQLAARLENPYWMQRPETWIWVRPDGRSQGFASLMHGQPGLCNLLWLAMDLGFPPFEYDAMSNTLYMMLTVDRDAKLLERPLHDVAGLVSLPQFVNLLDAEVTRMPTCSLERAYPLMRLLARRRLGDAHT